MPKVKDRQLTARDIHAGYQAALQQSRSLASEASLLLAHDHVPGAFHRLVIALEELGKARVLFYQGALLVGGRHAPWKDFWREYYSHESKLEAALTWLTLEELCSIDEADAIPKLRDELRGYAKELDRGKQSTSYSEPADEGFATPTAEDFRPRVSLLSGMVDALLRLAESSPLTRADADEFEAQLGIKYKFALALGYLDGKSESEFYQTLAQSNQTVYVRDGDWPDDQAFLARVAGRYEVVPERIPVTLQQLHKDPMFADFYHQELKGRRGYPDWVILCTLFNMSLNARLDQSRMADPEYRANMANWREDPQLDQPLDASEFTDISKFETTLSAWLVSFLAGLGIALTEAGPYGEHARRVAAKYYGFFDRDVEHSPLLPPAPH